MLRARDLWKQGEEQKNKRMAAMRPVLTQLFAKIKTHSFQYPDSPYMTFEVPTIVWGYPLYDIEEAIGYLHEVLTDQGFQVWFVQPRSLFISWLKPTKEEKKSTVLPKTEYRPFVYDDAAFEFLANKTEF